MLGIHPRDNGNFTSVLAGALSSPPIWSGLTCYAVSVVLWLLVLSQTEVGRAYPLQGLGYVFVAVAGWWMLGETISVSQMVGIFVIWVGAYLVLYQ
jgi:multidrug transporter EmrE-like cation transporter